MPDDKPDYLSWEVRQARYARYWEAYYPKAEPEAPKIGPLAKALLGIQRTLRKLIDEETKDSNGTTEES
jgi:hypothetical protein